jgi:muconolactone D-isomerase
VHALPAVNSLPPRRSRHRPRDRAAHRPQVAVASRPFAALIDAICCRSSGMEFLVHIQVNLPADMPSEDVTDLLAREAERGRELKRAGTIARMWRIPGRRANVGIWQAPHTDSLHEAIMSLPAFGWLDVQVTALATHHLEAADDPSGTDSNPQATTR